MLKVYFDCPMCREFKTNLGPISTLVASIDVLQNYIECMLNKNPIIPRSGNQFGGFIRLSRMHPDLL